MADPDQLFLRPTVIGGDRLEHDFEVIWDGIRIGRILQQPGVPVDRPNWSWSVAFPHKPQASDHRGLCSDREECQRRFKVAWKAVHARLSPSDIEAARRQQEDTRKRWPG
jgi:hypothetical protein